jgi:uncharacterized damage-inducible protein DinB
LGKRRRRVFDNLTKINLCSAIRIEFTLTRVWILLTRPTARLTGTCKRNTNGAANISQQILLPIKFILAIKYNVFTINCNRFIMTTGKKINSYIQQFEQLYSGGSWQDESFEAKLQDITEETAFMQPLPGVHSIAEIMWHSLYWRTVLIKQMEGNYSYKDETAEKYNFLPIETLKQKGWSHLWNRWKKNQEQIIQYLREKTDHDLEEKGPGKNNLEYIVEGIVQHDIYHLGQIGLIKKIMSLK